MNLKPINILLADDDHDDRTFFSRALTELAISANLTTVDDGDELMKLLLNDKLELPDVLFLDINMPRKNGLECLAEIKNDERLKDLPVVMFSTSDSRDKIKRTFRNGAKVYIHKPSDFAQLKQLIHHALPISTEKKFPGSELKYILNA